MVATNEQEDPGNGIGHFVCPWEPLERQGKRTRIEKNMDATRQP
jgi:hypothetical protein